MKIIYMSQTIEIMGKLNPKETQAIIDSGEVRHIGEDIAYLVVEDKK
jgi:hypothetical protein